MANVYDQFDAGANPYNQFDAPAAPPQKIGADAFPDFLKQELANADWGTRNIAGFGTAASDIWQKLKQVVGQGDPQAIEANRIIEQAAPVGAIAGNVAATAIPFGMVGNGIADAAKVGTVMGALNPVEGETSVWNKKGVGDTLEGSFWGGLGAAAGQGVTNAAGKAVSNKLADLQALMQKNAPRTETVNNALDAGLALPPNAVNPNAMDAFAQSIGGKSLTEQAFSNRNAPAADAMLRKELYLPENAPLTTGSLQAARDKAYEVGYKPVADTPYVNWDPQFIKAVGAISPASAGGAVKNPAQAEISDLVDRLQNKNTWTGPQLVSDIRSLRQQANQNYRAANMPGGNVGAQDLAHAQTAASDALEKLAQRNITTQGGDPQALQLLKDAREYIAKTHDVEDALVGGGGTIDARVLARKYDSNPDRMTGAPAIIGAAANNFPAAFQPLARVGGAGTSALNVIAGSALGGSIGGFNDHPYIGSIAGPLALALARGGARGALLSKMSQNRLRDIYRLGLAPRAANGLLQYAPVAGAVLGREALSQ